MHKLHYILIARHLTGDSELLFFRTMEDAQNRFNSMVRPLIKVCNDENIHSDEVWERINHALGDSYRFNSGHNDKLDDLLNETDTYIQLGTFFNGLPEPKYFAANFYEYIEDCSLHFTQTESEAHDMYEGYIKDEFDAFEDNNLVVRSNKDTWSNEEGMTLFQENETNTEAYIGWSDVTSTIRWGEITYQ